MARERWSKRSYFIFAALGSAIGLGNLWRFPALTYANGGGAFLIAWMVGLLVMGIPWMIMEYGMGKHFQSGAPGVYAGIGKKWEWLGLCGSLELQPRWLGVSDRRGLRGLRAFSGMTFCRFQEDRVNSVAQYQP